MDGEQSGVVAVADLGMQHRQRLGIPPQPQVALVGRHHHATFACPSDHLAQVIDAQHPSGWVARRVQVHQCRGPGPQLCQRVGANHLRPREPGPDVVGGIRQLGNGDQVGGPETQQRREPSDQFLGTDHRQHGGLGHPGDAEASTQGRNRRCTQLGCAGGGGIAGAKAAAASASWITGATGSTGVPMDRSTTPSECLAAAALASAKVSQGNSGRKADTAVRPPQAPAALVPPQSPSPCGGRSLTA